MNPKALEELARAAAGALGPDFARAGEDLRSNLRAAVGAALERTELVTREEFDVQRAVLKRTREKVAVLERRVAALENALNAAGEDSPGRE